MIRNPYGKYPRLSRAFGAPQDLKQLFWGRFGETNALADQGMVQLRPESFPILRHLKDAPPPITTAGNVVLRALIVLSPRSRHTHSLSQYSCSASNNV